MKRNHIVSKLIGNFHFKSFNDCLKNGCGGDEEKDILVRNP